MEWIVRNAISRDVERQQLNKILKEIRTTLDDVMTKLNTSSTAVDDAKVRSIVANMLAAGDQTVIQGVYNSVTKGIDWQTRSFTIALTGDVTGSGLSTNLGNVSITTTANGGGDGGIDEAPLDGLAYWRNNGSWEVVPFPAQTIQFITPPGFTVLDEDLNWYARTIEGVTGEIVITDGDGILANPVIGLADVPDGGGGILQKTDFDAKGRKTGTSAATTDDLTEGATNLYFTDTRVYEKVRDTLVEGTGITLTPDDIAETITIDSTGGIVLDYLADPATDDNADLYDTIVALLADMQAKGLMEGPPPVPMSLTGTYPDGTELVAYSETLTLGGDYVGPVTFDVFSGAIPAGAGWNFDTATSELSNASPAVEGPATFVIRATDSSTPTPQEAFSVSQSVEIVAAGGTGRLGSETSGGSGSWGTSGDRAMLTRWDADEDGNLDFIDIGFLDSIDAGGPTNIKGLVYADTGSGLPGGTLVAVGTVATIPDTNTGGRFVSNFAGEAITNGTRYWIGFVADSFSTTADSGAENDPGRTVMYNGTLSYSSPPGTAPSLAGEPGPYTPPLAAFIEYTT